MPDPGVTPKRPMALVHARGIRPRRSRLGALARGASINTSNTSDMPRTFACPFYRKDPFQHMDCVNYTLTRLSDVKQHLQRRHLDHLIVRCPICNEAFTSFAERDKHVNSSASCSNSPSVEFAQFGHEQRPHSKLKARSSRRATPSEMYFDLWDTIFDKETRPLNPYRGPIFLETIAALREFWETEKSSIITNTINEHPQLLIMDVQSLSTAFLNMFDRLQSRFEDCVRNRRSIRAVQIPAFTGHLDEPKASLEVGEPYSGGFGGCGDPPLGQGMELSGNQLPNFEYPMSLVPQLYYQDPAAAANGRIPCDLQNSSKNENHAVNEDKDDQASGEASIGTSFLGDVGSEFHFDYDNFSNFEWINHAFGTDV